MSKPLDQQRISRILGSTMEPVPPAVMSVITQAVPRKHILILPQFVPTTINEMLKSVRARIRGRRGDDEIVRWYASMAGIPNATGKRRVSFVVTKPNKGKLPDPDAFWKSLLDSLVRAKLLVDDSIRWCEQGKPDVRRGERGTVVTLEECE